jgi:hypothetical protein
LKAQQADHAFDHGLGGLVCGHSAFFDFGLGAAAQGESGREEPRRGQISIDVSASLGLRDELTMIREAAAFHLSGWYERIRGQDAEELALDPVCHMQVHPLTAAGSRRHRDEEIFFCS